MLDPNAPGAIWPTLPTWPLRALALAGLMVLLALLIRRR